MRWIPLALAVLLSACGTPAPSPTPTPVPPTPTPLTGTPIPIPTAVPTTAPSATASAGQVIIDFTFTPPSGWVIAPSPGGPGTIGFASGDHGELITVEQAGGAGDLSQALDAALAGLKTQPGYAETAARSSATVAGEPALRATVTYTAPSGGFFSGTVKSGVLVVDHKGARHTVRVTSAPGAFSRADATLGQVFASWHWTP